jgi:hypothetical protein
MHILEYLRDPRCEKKPKDSLTSEYRLLCSGTLYRDVGGDPYKSEVARILLDEPFLLFATSRPLDDYPLEMVLEITVPHVQEEEQVRTGQSIYSFHPDEEVAKDFAALLCLLCRRLITVSGKVSERHSDYTHPLFGQRPFPMPMATTMRRVSWRPHPLSVLYPNYKEGPEYEDYNPRPKALEPRQLTELLIGLPQLEHSESIVAACRLYSLALQLIHERPDISYQLLISSVETMANAALEKFQPDDDAKVEHKKAVYELAIGLGLTEEAAKKLAIVACKGEYWATKKFKKYLTDNVADSVWTEQDELFHRMSNAILPRREHFEKTLGNIYKARSKATHVGEPFPISASYTGGPNINVRAANLLFGIEGAFPPVVWFERIVHSALSGFWERSMAATGRKR